MLSLSLRVTRRNTVKPPALTIFGARQVCRVSTAIMRRLADATPPKRCPLVARGGHAGLGRAPVSSDSLRDQAFVGGSMRDRAATGRRQDAEALRTTGECHRRPHVSNRTEVAAPSAAPRRLFARCLRRPNLPYAERVRSFTPAIHFRLSRNIAAERHQLKVTAVGG